MTDDTTATCTPDRIRLPMSFDAGRMDAEVAAMNLHDFLEYSVIPLRSPAHLVDSSLPPPPPAEDYADGTWTEWLDTQQLKTSPYLASIVDTFHEQTRVTLVRLLRLEPGAIVQEHNDPTLGLEQERSVVRLTIPVSGGESVTFYLNDEPVPMQPGECWYLRLSDPHRITHEGSATRINMTIDLEPNEWLRSLLRQSDPRT